MRAKFDFGDVFDGLDQLEENVYSIARTMGAAAGAALRDEAKTRVRRKSGLLGSAIYVAFDDESTASSIIYSVSWNRQKAPHGHLIEFGHWRTNVVVQQPNGQWITTKERLPQPKWVPAHPFLRPAFDSLQPRLVAIAVEAGKRKFNEQAAET